MKPKRIKRKLQRNFVLLSLAALTLLLSVVFLVNALLSWQDQTRKADLMIREIMNGSDAASRYFSVSGVPEKGMIRVEKMNNLSLTEEKALKLAEDVLQRGWEEGYASDFRYRVFRKDNAVRILFLLRTTSIEMFRSSMLTLGIVMGSGLLLAALILILVSGRVVKPLTDNHKRQKEFITGAGHELKTPLTVMRTDAALLEAETGENEWLQDLNVQIDRMAKMTERLVTLARAEELEEDAKSLFSLTDAANDLLESYRAILLSHQRELKTAIQENISIVGDERSIRELLAILLDNADKYCPAGGQIEILLEKKHHSAVISVKNTAENAVPGEKAFLTERFARGKNAGGKAGFGLGLAIAAAVVENHQGSLRVSVPEENIFSVTCTLR